MPISKSPGQHGELRIKFKVCAVLAHCAVQSLLWPCKIIHNTVQHVTNMIGSRLCRSTSPGVWTAARSRKSSKICHGHRPSADKVAATWVQAAASASPMCTRGPWCSRCSGHVCRKQAAGGLRSHVRSELRHEHTGMVTLWALQRQHSLQAAAWQCTIVGRLQRVVELLAV
jgi:hypothetical protein